MIKVLYKFIKGILLVFVGLCICFFMTTKKRVDNTSSELDFIDNGLIVTLNSEVSNYRGVDSRVMQLFDEIGVISVDDLSALPDVCICEDGDIDTKVAKTLANHYEESPFLQTLYLHLNLSSKDNVTQTMRLLESSPYVFNVSPNFIYSIEDSYPAISFVNDALYLEQWAIQSGNSGISLPEAWGIASGSDAIKVGIVDTGIVKNHPDLESVINRELGGDFYNINKDGSPGSITYPTNINIFTGHGTMVSGVIGAKANNGLGISGITQQSTLVPMKIDNGYGKTETSESKIRAINYARDSWISENKIDIINFSWGGYGISNELLSSINNFPGLFVWAAGNIGENVDDYVGINDFQLSNLISVGARDRNNQRSIWYDDNSNYSSNYGNAIDIFAPGGRQYGENEKNSENLVLTTADMSKSSYVACGGTSIAAPHVAGVAALLLSVNPDMTGAELKQAIIDGSDMIEIDTPVGKQKVRNLNAYGALHQVGAFRTANVSDTEIKITGINKIESEYLMIPATYNGKKVVAINDYAFKYLTGVKSVIISESVTSIGNEAFAGSSVEKVTFFRGKEELEIGYRAFAGCDALSDITIPDRTASIGYQAFADCDILRTVSLQNGASTILKIDKEAFLNCKNLLYVNIPGRAVEIGDKAFSGCIKMYDLWIEPSINSLTIGECAFEYCSELKEVSFPERVTSIGAEAFADCYNLQKVEIENSLYNRRTLTLGDCAFIGCINLTGMDIPSRVTRIGVSCFQGCTKFKRIYFGESLNLSLEIGERAFYNTGLIRIYIPFRTRKIGNRAFAECSELTEVDFAEGVNSINIGSNAFYNCKKLVSVTIPNTVSTLGAGAFGNCTALSEITLWADFTEISNDLFNGCSALEKVAIYGKITKIGNCAFSQCTSLTNIDLGDYTELQTIGNYAFNGTAIKTVNIPNTVNYIGAGAFGNCSGLTSIVLPSGVTEISDELFNGCSNLGQVTINGKITRIGNYAFSQCTSLSTVQFGDMGGLQTIGNHAFDSTLISAIDIPNSVTTIGNNAFAWCTRLTSVGISKDSGLTSIGDFAFDNTAISEIYLPDTLTSIGQGAFRYCEFLTSVILPKNIESIENGMFCGCVNLREAIIPSGVTYIGEYAFYRCKKLDNIVLPSTLNYIGSYAFVECRALSGIVLPNNIETIGERAFQYCSSLKYLDFEFGSNLSIIPYGMCMDCVRLEYVDIPLNVIEIAGNAFYKCAFTELVLPARLNTFADSAFKACWQLQKIYITNIEDMIQISDYNSGNYISFSDCPMLDEIYVYDVQLAMEYKQTYDILADRIVTVGFDWALVTDSDHISDKYLFDFVFDYDMDSNELITVVRNEAVNGVLFYLTGNDVYDMSCYGEICCYDIPVIVISLGSVAEGAAYTVIRPDTYSLGYGIAESYIAGLYDYAGVYLYDILLDIECFPVIVPQSYRYNLSFLMGMSHMFGLPVKAVERYDELDDWKNDNDIYFENWLCFIDSTNVDIVKLTFNNNIEEYYVSCGFSYSRQYLSEFEYKFVIKNTSVITDIAEKRILGESFDFIDYTFDVDMRWAENNVNTDHDNYLIDWYENEWINDDYNALTEQEIEAEQERYSKILEFYADKSAYITDNCLCYVEQKVRGE